MREFSKELSQLLNEQWRNELQGEFDMAYMDELANFLHDQTQQGKIIYPSCDNVFAALNSTPLSQVKVVILGQDPYHGQNQAHGLSFSVPTDVKIPPSLRNIYKELMTDMGISQPEHGNLSAWAAQGVLLLNSVLTVENGLPASHQGKGWETFTDKVIELINSQCSGVVFLLWGAYAQKKARVVDDQRHLILRAPHPSPLSAHRGFLGCEHFSQTNAYLKSNGKTEIDWQIS